MKNLVSSFLVCVSDCSGRFSYSLFVTTSRSSAFKLARGLARRSAAGTSVLLYSQSGVLVARFSWVGRICCNTFAAVPRSSRRLSHVSFLYYLERSRSCF